MSIPATPLPNTLKPSDRPSIYSGLSKHLISGGNVGRSAKYHLGGRVRGRPAPNPTWSAWVAKSDLILDDDEVLEDVRRQLETGYAEDASRVPPSLMQVNLSDLIRPQRKRKDIAQEYEFVARLPPVLIIEDTLRDVTFPSFEEDALDWEVLSCPDSPTSCSAREMVAAPRTYASALISAPAGKRLST